jgi:hypothetical protein
MLPQWLHRTNQGKIKYERPKHYYNVHDAWRVCHAILRHMTDNWELEKDPKYNDIWEWEHIADIAFFFFNRFYKKPAVSRIYPVYSSSTKKDEPTPLHWTAARLIYWIEQIKGAGDLALSFHDIPFVSEVWKYGMWILDQAVKSLKDKMGFYHYAPASGNSPETLTF